MVRTKARENAFLLLFQSSFDGADISDILSANAEVGEIETDEFCEKLISGVTDNKDEIDAVMEKHLKNWKKRKTFENRPHRSSNGDLRNVFLRRC